MNFSRYYRHLPNAITIFRVALLPAVGVLLAREDFRAALIVFLIAGASDAVDGYLARRLNAQSRLGSILDPLADKFLVITAVVGFACAALIPWWLAAAVVVRDVVIVTGASAYFIRSGGCEMTPTLLSKLNTCIQISFILTLLAHAGALFDAGRILPYLFAVTLATTVASGVQYVAVWSRKAAQIGKKRD